MNPYLMHDLAQQRERAVVQRAARSGLAAVVRCCRPSALARLARALAPRSRAVCC